MTLLCAAIFAHDAAQVQRDSAAAAEAGADFVELRIDTITDPLAVNSLVRASSIPAIVTCRPTWEGGQSDADDEQRLQLLGAAAEAGAGYLDIELETFRRTGKLRRENTTPRDQRSGVIVSSHHFQGRPNRLTNIVTELAAAPGDVSKVVWTARTIRDNLEAFELLQRRQKPTIALCMGEAGLISRILAKKFGAFLTFASLEKDHGTAPGQISIHDMKRLYRWDDIGPATKVYGVVGHPVAHSKSPAIHNAAFSATGHDGVYLPLLVNPGYESFKAFMESFLHFDGLNLSGLSVTLPHKENALKYLQEKGGSIEPLAERIGAVNTIVVRPDGLRGLNTDYAAILDSITAKLNITREALSGYRVAVIGAGGTGRTAVAALAHYGATVVVYNRSRDRADALAAEFTGKSGKVVAASMEKLCDSCCQIYINTTSVGMHPNVDETPINPGLSPFSPDTLVFEAIYNPPITKLLQDAQAKGAPIIGGIEMFVRQAAAQFEAWTHKPAPRDLMHSIVSHFI